jgi:glycosyltransferase involved in cell wall biosynthesis
MHMLSMAEQPAPATNDSVSVVIPAYRAAKTIERAIGSALAQTLRPMEIIVVDDGSDDDTADIATDLLSSAVHVRFQVLVQGNLGAGASRNRGIAAATADYVAFLDADDEWLAEKLERSLECLKADNADMASHDMLRMEGGRESYVDCTRHFLNRRDPFADYVLRGYIATSTVVAKRTLLMSSGGFDPSLRSGQDYELWLSIIAHRDVHHVVFPMALTRYHVTPNSITSRVERRRQASLRILFRHLPALADRCETPRRVAVLRVVVITVQAAVAHKRAGAYLAGFGAFLRMPIHVLSALTGRYNRHYDRPNFIRD